MTGDNDGNATIWDLTIGEAAMRLDCRWPLVGAVAIGADGMTVATAGQGGEITIWETMTGRPLQSFTVPAPIASLALVPNADRVVVGGNCSLAVYGFGSGAVGGLLASLGTRHRVTAIAVNPVLPTYVLFGTISGQVAYVHIPPGEQETRPKAKAGLA